MRERNHLNLEPGALGVRLALDVPVAIGGQEFRLAEILDARAADPRPAMRQLVGPDVLLVVRLGVQHRSRFQHHHVQPAFRQHLGGGAARRPRADDAHVIHFSRADDFQHGCWPLR